MIAGQTWPMIMAAGAPDRAIWVIHRPFHRDMSDNQTVTGLNVHPGHERPMIMH
jgi:hypothetical protein